MKDTIDAVGRAKFSDPMTTASGEERAEVQLTHPETLWFNTGTLCNIECASCYIESSPTNDRLVYLTTADVTEYLDQLEARAWNVREIAFTGGEPFMNPAMTDMARAALERGYEVLILTNAMRPMMRKSVRAGLVALQHDFRDRLTLRISVDHWSARHHDTERGAGAFEKTLEGMRWLRDARIRMTVAGRTVWGEGEAQARAGYAALYEREGFAIDACWGILNKSPADVMCSSSRMVVKRRGAARPAVVACTLLPYEPEFELGATLEEAERPVRLNHPHCAKFCVLGGASCSV